MSIFRTLRSWLRVRMRQGAAFQWQLGQLQEHEHFSPSDLRRLQDGALRRILVEAGNTPHYREAFRRHGVDPMRHPPREVLAALPFLTKEEVRANPGGFLNPRHAKWLLRKAHTSGTSGTPLVCWRTMDSIRFEHAALWRQWYWAGVRPGMVRATLRGDLVAPVDRQEPPFWHYDSPARQLTLSSYHLAPRHAMGYRQAIQMHRPALIEAYPSSAASLATLLHSTGLEHFPVRAVLTSSETLLDTQRETIEAFFQAPVFDHYGNTERTNLIQQCPHGNYHTIDDYGLTEFLPVEGEPGTVEIVGTPFFNTGFILLRYRTGDWATLDEDAGATHLAHPCPCGLPFGRIKTLLGRTDAFIITPEGARIGRMDHVLKGVAHVAESRIVQEALDRLVIEVVPAEGWGPADAALLEANTRKRVGPSMTIEIRLVETIERTGRGKFVAVVSKVPQ